MDRERLKDGCMDEKIDEQMDGWTNGHIDDRQLDGWMNGWTSR